MAGARAGPEEPPSRRFIPVRTVEREILAMARAASSSLSNAVPAAAAPATLEAVAEGVQACRRCELWREATQGVAGEGAAQARLMLVGEQPGNQEDLEGRPFVGPAGRLLNRALEEASIPRQEAYVTNAVKHFRHEQRGKRRIHQTPTAAHVSACRWWLDAERAIVRPRVIVALGATAALGVFGKAMAIGKSRGRAFQLPDQAQAIVTYHPSFLLRAPDEAMRKTLYAGFVEDLKLAWKMAR
jgi:DNA polymerase